MLRNCGVDELPMADESKRLLTDRDAKRGMAMANKPRALSNDDTKKKKKSDRSRKEREENDRREAPRSRLTRAAEKGDGNGRSS